MAPVYMGILGLSIGEKVVANMRRLLKGTAYSQYATADVAGNIVPYYREWIKGRTAPQYTAPFQGDAAAKTAATDISVRAGIPFPVVDAFLYSFFVATKEGKVSAATFDPSIKPKPAPGAIDPKKLIYGGLVMGTIAAVAWLSTNLTRLIKG